MLARLGQVLHWFALVLVVGALATGAGTFAFSSDPLDARLVYLAAGAAVALLFYLIGRTFRYVLAGW